MTKLTSQEFGPNLPECRKHPQTSVLPIPHGTYTTAARNSNMVNEELVCMYEDKQVALGLCSDAVSCRSESLLENLQYSRLYLYVLYCAFIQTCKC